MKLSKKIVNNTIWLYGKHAVFAALSNPTRKCHHLLVTEHVYPELSNFAILNNKKIKISVVNTNEISSKLPKGVIHQNIAMEVSVLSDISLDFLLNQNQSTKNCIVILDQVNDTYNIGAILRTAAAFNVLCVIILRNNSPSETNTIAKAACGALEFVPLVKITNIVHTMNYLKNLGYWCVGLDGSASSCIEDNTLPNKTVLILGNEESGLRRLTKENCDFLTKISISNHIESLNVSNAAAIAMHRFYATHKATLEY